MSFTQLDYCQSLPDVGAFNTFFPIDPRYVGSRVRDIFTPPSILSLKGGLRRKQHQEYRHEFMPRCSMDGYLGDVSDNTIAYSEQSPEVPHQVFLACAPLCLPSKDRS